MRNPRIAILLGALVALGITACTKPAGEPRSRDAAATATAPARTGRHGQRQGVQRRNVRHVPAGRHRQAARGSDAGTEDPVARPTREHDSGRAAGRKRRSRQGHKVQARLDLLQTQILAEAASEKYMKAHPVSETEVKAEYDTQVAAMPKEYKARHILVEKKETAESLIRDLQAGGDLQSSPRLSRRIPGSAAKGGDLGWFSAQSMVKPFADALATLEKGAMTKTPVQTQYGWHVIQLEDSRSPKPRRLTR